MNDIVIREIEHSDNSAIATIIRQSLEEFGANKPGTVYFDKTTDNLFELFQSTPKSKYFIVEKRVKLLAVAVFTQQKG